MKFRPIGPIKPPPREEIDPEMPPITDPLKPPMELKRGPGRPKKPKKRGPKPLPCPDLKEVRNAASLGMFKQDVARLFGLSIERWYGIEKRYPKLQQVYDLGLAEGRRRALRLLNKKIIKGETGPLFFFLSRMGGYHERMSIEHETRRNEEVMSKEQAAQVAQAFLDQVKAEQALRSSVPEQRALEVQVIPDAVVVEPGVPESQLDPGLDPSAARAMGLSRPEPVVRGGGKISDDDEN